MGTPKRVSRVKKRHPSEVREDEASEQSGRVGRWLIAGMGMTAAVCMILGFVREGFDWRIFWSTIGVLLAGIVCVAIGLLELEWLEQLLGYWGGIGGFFGNLLWFRSSDTLSDSELIGRRGATVIWVGVGVPIFIWGCLMALRFAI
jgi:hypothetical protein